MKKIPLSRVFVNDEVREAGIRAMNSGWYILAIECEAFEAELAAYVGTKEAVLCSSWTTGALMLHHAMGVRPGDEILVPSHTAFPSIEPMIHRGAKPVFIDIDETYCIDVDQLEAAMSARTAGILPVHLYGHPANMDGSFLAAKKHGLWVVEDCAQAFGAQYRGNRVGSIAGAGAFSFFPSKNLTVNTVRFFDGKNENAPAPAIEPTRFPRYCAPNACAQSSTTHKPCFLAAKKLPSMFAGCP